MRIPDEDLFQPLRRLCAPMQAAHAASLGVEKAPVAPRRTTLTKRSAIRNHNHPKNLAPPGADAFVAPSLQLVPLKTPPLKKGKQMPKEPPPH